MTVSNLILPPKLQVPATDPLIAHITALKAAIGDMPDFDVFHNQVLVVKFIRKTVGSSGSLLSSEQTQTEDKWQGKCGMVVKLGPSAFQDEGNIQFYGKSVKAGDWVLYRNTDGWDFDYYPLTSNEKFPCRVLQDAEIKAVVTRPDLVW